MDKSGAVSGHMCDNANRIRTIPSLVPKSDPQTPLYRTSLLHLCCYSSAEKGILPTPTDTKTGCTMQ